MQWRALIPEELLQKSGMTLVKTAYSNHQNKIFAQFQCESPLEYGELQLVEDCLRKPFERPEELEAQFVFCGGEKWLQQGAQTEEYLLRALGEAHSALRPMLHEIALHLDGGALTAVLPSEAAEIIWKRRQVSEWLAAFVSAHFGVPLAVHTTVEERHALDAENPHEKPKFAVISKENKNTTAEKKPAGPVIFGQKPKGEPVLTPLAALNDQLKKVTVEGCVFESELKPIFGGAKAALTFDITDYEDSVSCKLLLEAKEAERISGELKNGTWVRVAGAPDFDRFVRDLVIEPKSVVKIDPPAERMDTAEGEKRVELHLHTQLSTKDGVLNITSAVKRAKRWGHTAMAVTDHGVVQAFPEFYSAAKKEGIQAIFGMEGYLVDDCSALPFDSDFVVVDIETTGIDKHLDRIIEIAAVKVVGGQIVDRFESFVNPVIPVPEKITKLTGITTDMVMDAPPCDEVLKRFEEFSRGCVFVAHNASFDVGFLTEHGKGCGVAFLNPYVDTLMLARYLLRSLKHHKLDDLTEYFSVSLDTHHRAMCDTAATAEIFLKLAALYREAGAAALPGVTPRHAAEKPSKRRRNHIIFLVKDAVGLKNLYKLVTYSHLNHFDRRSGRPCIPRSLLMMHREGLIVGSACEAGELFRAVLNGLPKERLEEIASFYDYLEVQPIGNNAFLVREGRVENEEGLRVLNRTIVELAERLGKPCAATCDVHFLDPHDEYYRRIIMASQGFSDADEQAPLYLKTTDEMLEEFAYLGKEKAHEIVVEVPNALAAQCEMLKPFPFETCAPEIEGAEEELIDITMRRARELYGDPLPEIVKARLDRELGSITKYGFSVLYIIAEKLVKKSNSDGYLVGSRGSVGSSLVAFMAGITEVNALQPHYVCPNCRHSDFDVDLTQYSIGVDMPDKNCPVCGAKYKKDGYSIPFETFLGFEGDKVPDIDLNFSGEYQPTAHKFCEELFGEGHVFRAGTISSYKDKTAYGAVMKYFDNKGEKRRNAEVNRLVLGCSGTKTTTGQHPGGIVVVPRTREVFEFTPLQHPADKSDSGVITTHFDFRSMHDTLVKLDILGHDDPTAIRMLQDITGIDPKTIPQDDQKVMSLFSSTEALGVDPKELRTPVGTYGIPEFGTNFVRNMLVETRPTRMDELVRISGLSHGTDVWNNNAQTLIEEGTATLSTAICTRDDIMNFLILSGVDKKLAFTTMESVRKGKGLKPEMEEGMRAVGIPQWYIDSCWKIKYMFPRAHAAAYVMMAFRIAYFKVYYPAAFYATYFTVRADTFDLQNSTGGAKEVAKRLNDYEKRFKELSAVEKDQITILELVLEMNLRGIEFLPIDINTSDAMRFLIVQKEGKEYLLPPFNALGGMGEKASRAIADARKEQPFTTQEDIMERAHVGKSTLDLLKSAGCLETLPESNQVSLFSL